MDNPWLAEDIQAFVFINCPECPSSFKHEDQFQDHALENHPRSSVFFNETLEVTLIQNEDIVIESIFESPVKQRKEIQSHKNHENIQYLQLLNNDKPEIDETGRLSVPFHGLRKKPKESVEALIKVLNVLGEEKYTCIICDESFPTQNQMRDHTYSTHADDTQRLKCRYCEYRYPKLYQLNKHMLRRHVKLPDKKCDDCGVFIVAQHYRKHRAIHHTKKEQCKLCEGYYPPAYMGEHVKAVHPDKSKIFKCDLCSYTTHCRRYVTSHRISTHFTTKDENGE